MQYATTRMCMRGAPACAVRAAPSAAGWAWPCATVQRSMHRHARVPQEVAGGKIEEPANCWAVLLGLIVLHTDTEPSRPASGQMARPARDRSRLGTCVIVGDSDGMAITVCGGTAVGQARRASAGSG